MEQRVSSQVQYAFVLRLDMVDRPALQNLLSLL